MQDYEIKDKLFDTIPDRAGEEATYARDEYQHDAFMLIDIYDKESASTYKITADITVVGAWEDWCLNRYEILSIVPDSQEEF